MCTYHVACNYPARRTVEFTMEASSEETAAIQAQRWADLRALRPYNRMITLLDDDLRYETAEVRILGCAEGHALDPASLPLHAYTVLVQEDARHRVYLYSCERKTLGDAKRAALDGAISEWGLPPLDYDSLNVIGVLAGGAKVMYWDDQA